MGGSEMVLGKGSSLVGLGIVRFSDGKLFHQRVHHTPGD